MQTQHLGEPSQQGGHFRSVPGPLLPGVKEVRQGGVGQDDQGGGGGKTGQLPGQPLALGRPDLKDRSAGCGVENGV
jgi:hypothetical protein